MRLNTFKPLGPHVTGVIRFAGENHGTEDYRQLDHFEVFGRSYEGDEAKTYPPRLKEHPLAQQLRGEGADSKVRVIPIKLVFDKPENSLSARYEAFDRELNRLACCGDGESAARADFGAGEVNKVQCPGPDACSFANEKGLTCQLSVRLKVQVDGQTDPLSVFEFQSGGIHSYRNLSAKLSTLHALLGGRLRGVPLALKSYERGSAAHEYKPFYVVDLVLRDGDALEALAAGAEAAGTSRLAFGELEATFEKCVAEAPFTVSDEYDSGVVVFNRPTSAPPRAERRPTDGGAARTIASIVELASSAAAAAAGPSDAQVPVVSRSLQLQPIVSAEAAAASMTEASPESAELAPTMI